ncbi:MAG TPA: terminase family protein [Croceibacterium sp.]|nr:terminase family protein [Croceibacterium sp.]
MPTIPDILLGCDAAGRAALVRSLPGPAALALDRAFAEWAHGGQLAPPGDWRTWVLMAGRGFGKTRAGAEWVLGVVRDSSPDGGGGPCEAWWRGTRGESNIAASGSPPVPLHHPAGGPPPRAGEELRIALVAATVDEARKVMVEGPSGILACARPGEIAGWSRAHGELVFASGARATLFSGANPQALRGPQHHFAWCDELAKWRHPQAAWDMLQLGLRCGARPRALVTTTPRGGCAALRRIVDAPDTVLTGGRTGDNPHLPAAFLRAVESAYGGTRMAREEIDGVLLPDVAGSLWPAALLERCRGAAPAADDLRRVVVGVDPPASAGGTCGIVVCALDADGVGHVLADRSAGGLSPEGWARAVAAAAEMHGADRVVAERNMGGDMVRSVLRGAGVALPISEVSATRGKVRRAEPVAGQFEAGKARLAGRFPELEDELAGLVAGGDYEGPGRSPDRADAMVWALWALLLAGQAEPRVHSF